MLHIIEYIINTPHSQSARYPQEKCAGNSDFIRLHVAGASEASTMRNDLNCMECGHKLEENVKYCTLGGICKYIASQCIIIVCIFLFLNISISICMYTITTVIKYVFLCIYICKL